MSSALTTGLAAQTSSLTGRLINSSSTGLSGVTMQIAAGRIADLLVLDADPEQDVKAFRSPSLVVRAGVLHERAALLPRGP